MPTLACRVCGRVVYATAALDTLFAEERRCPRCGSMLFPERRADTRRKRERRGDVPNVSGSPAEIERRTSQRRRDERRREDGTAS